MDRIHLHIRGRVQGVFFRVHTQDGATRIGLTGWVRNTADGGVEILAEGPKGSLQKLVDWCQKGSPMAHVTEVREEWLAATGEFKGFSIRY